MKAEFWHKKWEERNIGFHEASPNNLLQKHFKKLHLKKNSRVFIPLCGKTHDIHWITSMGHQVIGIELSKIAVDEFFNDFNATPEIKQINNLIIYRYKNIEIFVGDFFDLTQNLLGQVDAIYDRAALMALPYDLRIHYAKHLQEITLNAPQLLNCFLYNQSLVEGPPFSVNKEELKHHYEKNYQLTLLESVQLPNGVKQKCPGTENMWLLNNYSAI